MTEHIKIEKRDNILTLTFARPDKKNALTNAMYGALADAIVAAETDPAARVIVLRGEGDMFTVGQRCRRVRRHRDRRLQGRAARLALPAGAGARRRRPLVAAVQGRAVGVGTTMLLHCDFVLLAENAQLSTPFINLALVPEAASTMLMPLRIGYARAYEMFALGEPMDAADRAAAPASPTAWCRWSGCMRRRPPIAARLAKLPAGSLAATKRLMRNPAVLSAQIGAESQMLCRAAADGGGARGLYRLCRAPAAGFHQGRLNFPASARDEVGCLRQHRRCEGMRHDLSVMFEAGVSRCLCGLASNAARSLPKAACRRRPARSARTNGNM